MLDAFLLASLVAGLVPAALFTFSYAARSAWRSTPAGRAVMSLMAVTTLTYATSTLTLAWPEFFRSEPGVIVRISIRIAVALVLWNLYLVLRKSQHVDREETRIREHTEQ